MERKKSRSAPGAVLDRLASQDWLMLEELRRLTPKQAEAALTWQSPDDINRFQADQHQQFINWTKSLR